MTLTKIPGICFRFDFFLIKKENLQLKTGKMEQKLETENVNKS